MGRAQIRLERVKGLVQPPPRCRPRPPRCFLFRRVNEDRDDCAPAFDRRLERGVVRKAKVKAKPDD